MMKPVMLGAVLSMFGCGDDKDDAGGEGQVTATTYGEDFIEQGIPAEEVADGWAIEFESFIVLITDVEVGGVAVADAAPVELTHDSSGVGHSLRTATVPAGTHTGSSYTIAAVTAKGSATKGDVTKTFDWVFPSATRYTACETSTVVTDGGSATFQITVHADHLFYDSLVSSEPSLLFQPLADADADDDGVLTQAELAAADVGALDVGNEDVTNLWDYLVAQSRTLGHVDGEGHCDAAPL